MREVLACILGLFLIGLAHLATFPPFESSSEVEAYSRIQRVSRQGITFGNSPEYLTRDILDYVKCGIVSPQLAARLHLEEGQTFAGFAALSGDDRRTCLYEPAATRAYAPRPPALSLGEATAPLHALVMQPVYRLTDGLSWAAHIAWLRLASLLFGLAGLALTLAGGLRLCRNQSETLRGAVAVGALGWPILFPGWLTEVASAGPLGLALFLAGAFWHRLAALLTEGDRRQDYAVAGLLCGLGALVDPLFIAAGLGVLILLLQRFLLWYATLPLQREMADRVAGLLFYVFAFAGLSAPALLLEGGRLLGGVDLQAGAALLLQRFVAGGAESPVGLPAYLIAPQLILVAALVLISLGQAGRQQVAALCVAVPVLLLGLVPGQAVLLPHLLQPTLGFMIGIGLARLIGERRLGGFFIAIAVYASVYYITAIWYRWLVITGCAVVDPGTAIARFPEGAGCAGDWSTLVGLMTQIATPALALPLYAIGLLLVFEAVFTLSRNRLSEA